MTPLAKRTAAVDQTPPAVNSAMPRGRGENPRVSVLQKRAKRARRVGATHAFSSSLFISPYQKKQPYQITHGWGAAGGHGGRGA